MKTQYWIQPSRFNETEFEVFATKTHMADTDSATFVGRFLSKEDAQDWINSQGEERQWNENSSLSSSKSRPTPSPVTPFSSFSLNPNSNPSLNKSHDNHLFHFRRLPHDSFWNGPIFPSNWRWFDSSGQRFDPWNGRRDSAAYAPSRSLLSIR